MKRGHAWTLKVGDVLLWDSERWEVASVAIGRRMNEYEIVTPVDYENAVRVRRLVLKHHDTVTVEDAELRHN